MAVVRVLVPVLDTEAGRVRMPGERAGVSDAYADELVGRGLVQRLDQPATPKRRSARKAKEG